MIILSIFHVRLCFEQQWKPEVISVRTARIFQVKNELRLAIDLYTRERSCRVFNYTRKAHYLKKKKTNTKLAAVLNFQNHFSGLTYIRSEIGQYQVSARL